VPLLGNSGSPGSRRSAGHSGRLPMQTGCWAALEWLGYGAPPEPFAHTLLSWWPGSEPASARRAAAIKDGSWASSRRALSESAGVVIQPECSRWCAKSRPVGAVSPVIVTRTVFAPLPPGAVPPTPPAFVAEQAVSPRSSRMQLVLRSAITGHVRRTLGTFGQAFTNNGLAVTTNLEDVFYTLAPSRSPRRGDGLRVMRLAVASGRRSLVATGSEPALSPDDTQLAYGAYPEGLAVRDLHSAQTRTVSLTGQLGGAANLTLTSITWLADEDEVVLAAPAQFIAASKNTSTQTATGSCHPQRRPVLVFVRVPAAPAPLRAHCVTVPGLDTADATLAASPAQPDAVRVSSLTGNGFTIHDVTATGDVTPILGKTPGLPLAFSPAGDRLLYLQGHPPALWTARIQAGGLHARHRLVPNSQLGAAAW
jgi:hypothetical protein